MSGKICDCGKTLGAKNQSGRCRSCLAKEINARPGIREARIAGIHRKFECPVFRAEQTARLQKAACTPTAIAKRRERGRQQYRDVLSRPDVQARTQSVEARAKRGASARATWLAWCPERRRGEYRDLMRRKGLKAAEARAVIEADIAGTAAAAKREVASHQLQMRLKHERDLASRY